MDQVAEIEVFQFIVNQPLQRAVLPCLQMFIIQIPLQPVIHKVDVHLNGNLIIGDGGIGDTNLCHVAEICFRTVLALAELGDQPFCAFHKCLLGLPLQFQSIRLRLPFARKFFSYALRVHIVAMSLIVPHGIQGTKATIKFYHMEAFSGVDGHFFLLRGCEIAGVEIAFKSGTIYADRCLFRDTWQCVPNIILIYTLDYHKGILLPGCGGGENIAYAIGNPQRCRENRRIQLYATSVLNLGKVIDSVGLFRKAKYLAVLLIEAVES